MFDVLYASPSKFILSTWHNNDYRVNKYISTLWSRFNILTRKHFYHVGGSVKNRNPMIEAIVTNYDVIPIEYEYKKQEQLVLLEEQAKYQNA